MNLVKKIIQIFFLIFLTSFLASCEEGCVEADEFDTTTVTIESNPTNDGVSGNYDSESGGQSAEWHQTGLRSNGDQFVFQVTGAWTTWMGSEVSSSDFETMGRCNMGAKKLSPLVPNSICYGDQTPEIESVDGIPVSTDPDYCDDYANQNNPTACSCTKDPQWGTVLDYPTYHFPLDALDKNEAPKEANNQMVDKTNCKFDRGLGLYVGLFGGTGTEVPLRLYHMYSEEEICNVVRNSDNQCLDENGNDVTAYVFSSANGRIFMKDDNNGNDGSDTDTSDDVYHGPNEYLQLKIYDQYYSDNSGQYSVKIIGGVGDTVDSGLLEFLVSMVEDILLGAEDSDGNRPGGVIEYMYKAIVQDSDFVVALQVSLAIYISVYGASFLFGLVEMDRKEVMGRVLKISLILLFTSSSSWTLYNSIVVGLFKDSMDYVVAMIMSLSDANQDPSSMIIISQMERANDASNATRFSYVDLMIKDLFSSNTAKKIFGLFFGVYYGVILIPLIYALIGFFLYVMLVVASMYMMNVMKIIFVLSLGPIFMCLSLFSQTKAMFESWLGYLGARSLEIILLFSILYNFLILINNDFNDLLYFRTCREGFTVGPISINIMMSDISDRSLMTWIADLVTIGGLITIMLLVMEKVGDLAGSLIAIKIGGTSSKGSSGFGSIAAGAVASVSAAIKGESQKGDVGRALAALSGGVADLGSRVGTGIIRTADAAANASGLSAAYAKAVDAIPISGPRAMYRNNFIDSAISKSQAEAKAAGYEGKAADAFVRNAVHEKMQHQMTRPDEGSNPNTAESKPLRSALAGINTDTINQRLDKKLVQDPLKKFIKDEAKKLKNADSDKLLSPKAMRAELRKNAEAWAEKNLAVGSKGVAALVAKRDAEGKSQMNAIEREIKGVIKKESELTPSEAAKRFAGNPEKQREYSQYLKDKEFKQSEKDKKAFDTGPISAASRLLKRGYHAAMRDDYSNPKIAQDSFTRNLKNTEASSFYNPANRSNLATKAGDAVVDFFKTKDPFSTSAANNNQGTISERSAAAQKNAMSSYLTTDAKKSGSASDKGKEDKKRKFYQNQLRKMATKDLAKETKEIAKLERGDKPEAAMRREELFAKAREDFNVSSDRTLFEKAARMDYLNRKFGTESGEVSKTGFQATLATEHGKQVDSEAKKVEAALAAAGTDKEKLEEAKKQAAKLQSLRAGLFTKDKLDSSSPLAKALDVKTGEVKKGLEAKKAAEEASKKYGDPKFTVSGSAQKAASIVAARNPEIFNSDQVAENNREKARTSDLVHKEQMAAQERMDALNKNVSAKAEEVQKALEAQNLQRNRLNKELEEAVAQKEVERKKALEAAAVRLENPENAILKKKAFDDAERLTEERMKDVAANEAKERNAEKKKASDELTKLTQDKIKALEASEAKAMEEERRRALEAAKQSTDKESKALENAAAESRKKALEDAEKLAQDKVKASEAVGISMTEAEKKQVSEDAKKLAEDKIKASEVADKKAIEKAKEDSERLAQENIRNLELASQLRLAEERRKIAEDADKLAQEKLKALDDNGLKSLSEQRNRVAEEERRRASELAAKELMEEERKKAAALGASDKMTESEKQKALKDKATEDALANSIKREIGAVSAGEVNSTKDQNVKFNEVINSGGPELTNKQFSDKIDAITPDKMTVEEYKTWREAATIIVKDIKVEFGAAISDIMLKGFDIGLKPVNMLPGGDSKSSKIDQALVDSLKAAKSQIDMKAKIKKMDWKMKQFELDKAKTEGQDKKKIAALQQEADALESEYKSIDSNADKLEKQIEISLRPV